MTELLKTAALFLMTPDCFDQYFINFNFFHGECMKSTISKILGFVIVAGSVTVKVPQILKILKNKSGEGISLISASLELTAVTSFFMYSYLKQFPFSAWGDGFFMTIQSIAVLGLILYYKNLLPQLGAFAVGYATLTVLLLTGVLPLSFLWLMQLLNLPILIVGKGAQALTNYKSRSTGQLSAITCWMQFGGATARVFTSLQETGDTAIILSFVFASILNGIIAFQLLYYAKSGQKKGGKGKGKSKGKKSD